jgi:GT2 family glycosyltransferase
MAQPNEARPYFSIVTVTLNAGPDLLATALSVAAQRFRDYEYIIKDGGSTDGSVESLVPWNGMRVIRRPDTGIYDAMNQALAECRGEFVHFLNAGDVLLDADSLEQVAEALRHRPELYVLYTDVFDLDTRYLHQNPDRLTAFFLYWVTMCHQACFVRADAYRRVGGFDTELRLAADNDFLTNAVRVHRLGHARLPIAAIGYKGGGASASPRNASRLAAEKRVLRRRWFSRAERFAFDALYASTLPWLRRVPMMRSLSGSLRSAYVRFANGLRH